MPPAGKQSAKPRTPMRHARLPPPRSVPCSAQPSVPIAPLLPVLHSACGLHASFPFIGEVHISSPPDYEHARRLGPPRWRLPLALRRNHCSHLADTPPEDRFCGPKTLLSTRPAFQAAPSHLPVRGARAQWQRDRERTDRMLAALDAPQCQGCHVP